MIGLFYLLRALPALALLWVCVCYGAALLMQHEPRGIFVAFKCANVTTAIVGALWAITMGD
jgi:hypothetical protein